MATLPPELMARMGMGGGMPQMPQGPPGQPPAGAMTADGPMGPDMPAPSAGMQLAEMAGMLDQKVEEIQQALGLVTQILQSVLGAGAETADGPLGPEAQGLPPDPMDGMDPGMDPGMMEEEGMPMEEDPMGGMPFNAQQLAMQQ
jgi:hypothetical protein